MINSFYLHIMCLAGRWSIGAAVIQVDDKNNNKYLYETLCGLGCYGTVFGVSMYSLAARTEVVIKKVGIRQSALNLTFERWEEARNWRRISHHVRARLRKLSSEVSNAG